MQVIKEMYPNIFLLYFKFEKYLSGYSPSRYSYRSFITKSRTIQGSPQITKIIFNNDSKSVIDINGY